MKNGGPPSQAAWPSKSKSDALVYRSTSLPLATLHHLATLAIQALLPPLLAPLLASSSGQLLFPSFLSSLPLFDLARMFSMICNLF